MRISKASCGQVQLSQLLSTQSSHHPTHVSPGRRGPGKEDCRQGAGRWLAQAPGEDPSSAKGQRIASAGGLSAAPQRRI